MHRPFSSANDYDYVYDNIGNLERSETLSGVEGVTNTYSSNPLNQYTNISGAVTNVPTYDLDGNMVSNGDWTYTWNGENCMVSASNGSTVVSYNYDYMGRCYSKLQVSGLSTQVFSYVWDGYNIIAELSSGTTNYNVWGLDLSQSLQGAGGVGGLLAVVQNGTAYYPCYDGNGNVCDYVDGSGTVVAHYEYSPFGGITVASESKADDFTHRFSTKPFDADTGLVEYELRMYSPELGRFVSKDPIGERGGLNLYGFVGNDGINWIDLLGLTTVEIRGFVDNNVKPVGGTDEALVVVATVTDLTKGCEVNFIQWVSKGDEIDPDLGAGSRTPYYFDFRDRRMQLDQAMRRRHYDLPENTVIFTDQPTTRGRKTFYLMVVEVCCKVEAKEGANGQTLWNVYEQVTILATRKWVYDANSGDIIYNDSEATENATDRTVFEGLKERLNGEWKRMTKRLGVYTSGRIVVQ